MFVFIHCIQKVWGVDWAVSRVAIWCIHMADRDLWFGAVGWNGIFLNPVVIISAIVVYCVYEFDNK